MKRREFLKALPAFVPLFHSPIQATVQTTTDNWQVELHGGAMRVTVVAGAGGVWLTRFFLKRAPFDAVSFTSDPMTKDLLHPSGSGSALLVEGMKWEGMKSEGMKSEGMQWQAAHLGPAGRVTSNASSVHITGILIGPDTAPIAREEWKVTLHQDVLHWQIEREFLRQVTLRADRFPCLTMHTQAAEIVSFLDPEAQLQSPALFPLEAPPLGEMISSTRSQHLHLSPSGLVLESTMTAGYFSFAKGANGGTVDTVVIGSETVDRMHGPEVRQAGARQAQEWTLRRRDPLPIAPFLLELPDADLARQTQSFADVHNQWMGWIFGNNPASVSCFGEMAWFSMLQSAYATEPVTQRALDRYLEFFAATGVDSAGHVMSFWDSAGVTEGSWRMQIPHFILAVHEQVINTGRRDFLERMMPTLDQVAGVLLAMDLDHDGVFEDPNSGLADGGRSHCGNWYDIIEFGHKDAINNVYAVEALHSMAECKAYLGDTAGSQRFRELHARSKAAFNKVFWDDAKGFYMDWIDVREQMPESGRRYFYTDHNLLAIIYGIADPTQGQRILSALDERYDALCRQFNRQRDDLWATPCNMYPITQLGDMSDYGKLLNQKNYPRYENGGAFFHTTGLEIAARGALGQSEQAYATFERVMRGYARNRLWAAALEWNKGALVSEPLNNALLILWGFAYGCLGLRRTLQGVQGVGGCSQRLEGTRHTFRHLGKNVTVQVHQGRPAIAG